MLLTCYEEIWRVGRVLRMLATFRPSQHVKMVWRVANNVCNKSCMSCLWNLEKTRQTEWQKEQTYWLWQAEHEVAIILVRTKKLRGCYEKTASVEFRLYVAACSSSSCTIPEITTKKTRKNSELCHKVSVERLLSLCDVARNIQRMLMRLMDGQLSLLHGTISEKIRKNN